MAKRIKVKNNPPRGLSKKVRQLYDDAYRRGDHDLKISLDMDKKRDISHTPSSTRKKLVKEGSRKFIGPRQLKNELSEDIDARTRASEGNPVKYIEQDRGPGRRGEIYEVDEGGILPYETSRREMRKFKRLNKEGPSGRKRAMAILERIMNQYLGGGQEFDVEQY
jgi:hypothetical protein